MYDHSLTRERAFSYRSSAAENARSPLSITYGELGATSARVAGQVRAHKRAFRDYLTSLVEAAGLPGPLAGQLFLLAEGAMVTAGVTRSAEPAAEAREAARLLLEAA
jgi:hypothetical protein